MISGILLAPKIKITMTSIITNSCIPSMTGLLLAVYCQKTLHDFIRIAKSFELADNHIP